jgi:hypothetical protein
MSFTFVVLNQKVFHVQAMKLQRKLFNFKFSVYFHNHPDKKLQVFRNVVTISLGKLIKM